MTRYPKSDYRSRAPPKQDFCHGKNLSIGVGLMKNYLSSDYAANKYAQGIVYRFANETVEVTLEDYLRENPGKTEADFAELKALSDGIYEATDRVDYRQTWKNVHIHSLEETEAACVPSAEFMAVDMPELANDAKNLRGLGHQALTALTEVQRRRYLLYHVEGKTVREIANIENVAFQVIDRSILSAKKKIKKYLDGVLKTG